MNVIIKKQTKFVKKIRYKCLLLVNNITEKKLMVAYIPSTTLFEHKGRLRNWVGVWKIKQ